MMTLIQAVLSNDLAAATELLRQGQAVDRKDALGYTPLMLASGLGNPQMVELLLTAGADVSILDNRMGASALHKAAQSGVVDVAKLLLQRGAFINLQSPTLGHTPLMDAVWHKRAAMVACLLEQGAKMTLQSHYGATALDFAQRDNLTEMIHLLKQQEQINQQLVEKQALMAAVLRNDVEAVQQMIEQGVDVNEKSPMLGGANDGHTPLLVAARDGQVEIIKLLLEAGANPHLIDDLMKATPGHKAGYMGHAEVVQLLVKADLELDAQGAYNGLTALHDAIWHGHIKAAKVFIDANARLDLRSHTGKTPLEEAIEYGYKEIAALLQERLNSNSSVT